MIDVTKIEVLNMFNTETLLIRFAIEDTMEDINNYKFDVLRSNSPLTDYDIIEEDIKNFEYIDSNVNLYRSSLLYFYKIRTTNINSGEVATTDFYGQFTYREPDNIALTVMHQYDTYLDNVINNPSVHILQRKKFGTRCGCWDDIRMQRKKEFCEECYNTGYTGGYYSPVAVKINYLSTEAGMQQLIQQTDNGEQSNPIQAWIKNLPIVSIGDIIIDNINRRYEVINWQPTTKNGYLLRQVLTLSKLPASNIAYKIPLYTMQGEW